MALSTAKLRGALRAPQAHLLFQSGSSFGLFGSLFKPPAAAYPLNARFLFATSPKWVSTAPPHFLQETDKAEGLHQNASKQPLCNPYGSYSFVKPTAPLIDTTLHKVHRVRDMAVYESLAYNFDHLNVILFTANCSTASLVLQPEFVGLAAEYLSQAVSDGNKERDADIGEIHSGARVPVVFSHIDVDECPRAAYHADVDDVPTIVLMIGDDALRVKIAPVDRCQYDGVMGRLKEELAKVTSMPLSQISNLQSRTAWYDHHIRVDNMNVHRLGWPTV